jgi:hypothetical protein
MRKAISIRYGQEIDFEGCTDEELEELRQLQHVLYLPEVYRRVMSVMGKKGLSCIADGNACYAGRTSWKLDRIDFARIGIHAPPDAFVFLEHQGYVYNFFRTHDCDPDPAVYMYCDDDCFYQLAASFSDFLILEMSPDEQRKAWIRQTMQNGYRYDPNTDEMVIVPPPDYAMPIPKVIELMRTQRRGKTANFSAEDITAIQQAQSVEYLPDLCAQYLQWIHFYSSRDLDKLKQAKDTLIQQLARQEIAYPSDLFVFSNTVLRTHPHNENPAVYIFDPETAHFYKRASTLSEYIVRSLDEHTMRGDAWYNKILRTPYRYDPVSDEFQPIQ